VLPFPRRISRPYPPEYGGEGSAGVAFVGANGKTDAVHVGGDRHHLLPVQVVEPEVVGEVPDLDGEFQRHAVAYFPRVQSGRGEHRVEDRPVGGGVSEPLAHLRDDDLAAAAAVEDALERGVDVGRRDDLLLPVLVHPEDRRRHPAVFESLQREAGCVRRRAPRPAREPGSGGGVWESAGTTV
jgi:hypothetical protein